MSRILHTIISADLPDDLRQPLIFSTLTGLEPGQAIRLLHSEDPLALRAALQQHWGEALIWDYEEQGPPLWKITIGRRAPGELP